ncbi:MAG: hypothetical protein JXB08_05755 [Bacilli bacterium]|nr:hypothetical protein [Bacilli bacterium]MBN2877622.1 hypothetical protein [Bacilli bacterium]
MKRRFILMMIVLFTGILLVGCDQKLTITTTGQTTTAENTTQGNSTTIAITQTTTNTTFQQSTDPVYYTVTFVCEDATVSTQSVLEGEAAVAPIPTEKSSTAQYDYTFGHWDTDFTNVTGNLTVTAVYDASLRYYDVDFYNYDGTLIDSQSIAYGSGATAPDVPDRVGDVQYSYTFDGWDVDFSNITGPLDVTATFLQTINEYTVSFYDYDGVTLIEAVSTPYGSSATPPDDPTRASDEVYSYEFDEWQGDFSNITGDIIIIATYNKTYTTTGDYEHQLFVDLVAQTFDIEGTDNIEENIVYLQDIFETETEEEAYRIFNVLTAQYRELFEFENYSEFVYIFSSLESGFVTQDQLITYLFNYLSYGNNFYVGLSDLQRDWYLEVQTEYDYYLAEATSYFETMDQAEVDWATYLSALDPALQENASTYFEAYLNYNLTEKIKFSYFDSIRDWPDRAAYDLNDAIWMILDKDNIDQVTYDYYVYRYNSICTTYPGYQDEIDEYYQIMTDYYNAVQANNAIDALIGSDSLYEDIITQAKLNVNQYMVAFGNYDALVREDFEYWERQLNGMETFMAPYDALRAMFTNTENRGLYEVALNILIDDIQNMVMTDTGENTTGLSTLVTYIVGHTNMYNEIDLSDLFSVITDQGLVDTLQAISAMINLRYGTITTEEWIVLDDALNALVQDYVNVWDLTETEKAEMQIEYLSIANQYVSDLEIMFTQFDSFISSISLDEVQALENFLSVREALTTNEEMIELAKIVDDIMSDTTFDYETFLHSYLFVNFFQVDVHVEFEEVATIEANLLADIETFLANAHILATTDPASITQDQIDEFYDLWINVLYYSHSSYSIYLNYQ